MQRFKRGKQLEMEVIHAKYHHQKEEIIFYLIQNNYHKLADILCKIASQFLSNIPQVVVYHFDVFIIVYNNNQNKIILVDDYTVSCLSTWSVHHHYLDYNIDVVLPRYLRAPFCQNLENLKLGCLIAREIARD